MTTRKKESACHYHLCRKKAEVHVCTLCGNYYCEEHLKPTPPSLPGAWFKHSSYKDIFSIEDWRNPNAHPCPPYYDYLVAEAKRRDDAYWQYLENLVRHEKKHNEDSIVCHWPPPKPGPTIKIPKTVYRLTYAVAGFVLLILVISLFIPSKEKTENGLVVYDCRAYPDKCKTNTASSNFSFKIEQQNTSHRSNIENNSASLPVSKNNNSGSTRVSRWVAGYCEVYPEKCNESAPPLYTPFTLNNENESLTNIKQVSWSDIQISYPEWTHASLAHITKINNSAKTLLSQIPVKHLNFEYPLSGIYYKNLEELSTYCGKPAEGCWVPTENKTSSIYLSLPEVIYTNGEETYYGYHLNFFKGAFSQVITNPAQTLAHEIAHGVYYTYNVDNWSFGAPFVSDYAKTNEKEDFAETYAEYLWSTCLLYQRMSETPVGFAKIQILFDIFEKQIYLNYTRTDEACKGIKISSTDPGIFFRMIDKKELDDFFAIMDAAKNDTEKWDKLAKECNEVPSRCDMSTALGSNSSYAYAVLTYTEAKKNYEQKLFEYNTRWGEG